MREIDKRFLKGASLTINGCYAIFFQWGDGGIAEFVPSPQGRFFNYNIIQGVEL